MVLRLVLLCLLLPLAARAEPPAESLGRLNHAGYKKAKHCTAFLTGPRRAGTAAHCVEGLAAGELHLLLGYDRGSWQSHLRGRGASLDAGGEDIATVCLRSPAKAAVFPWAEEPPRRGERLVIWGYGKPRVHALSRRDCPVLRVGDRRLILDCPVSPGTSGAPVLRQKGKGYEVVAVVSGSRGRTAIAVLPAPEGPPKGCNE